MASAVPSRPARGLAEGMPHWVSDVTAKSTDGHTMVMGVVTAHVIAPHLLKLGYQNDRDLVPVAFVGAVPNVLVTSPKLGVNSVAELVALAKAKPGSLSIASSGTATSSHLAGEMLKMRAGIDLGAQLGELHRADRQRADDADLGNADRRSEERRVGKECEVPCRSRWSPYH